MLLGVALGVGLLVSWIGGAVFRMRHPDDWWCSDWGSFADPWARHIRNRVKAGKSPPTPVEVTFWSVVQIVGAVSVVLVVVLFGQS